MLHGHERSITQIKYNREGDLLFSCAKDQQPNVWYSMNGERLGSFKGHTGAVWGIDVDWETANVLTCAADNTCRIWDCETGKEISRIDTNTAGRTCGFSYSGNLVLCTTDKAMGHPCQLMVFDKRDDQQIRNNEPFMSIPLSSNKITASVWGPLDEVILTGHDSGDLCQWDIKAGDMVRRLKAHDKQINDIQTNRDQTMVITASKDCKSKLYDMYSLDHKKTYRTERPVNSAAISPTRPHVVLGGGQEAMDVTTTSTKVGKFDARFFDLAFEEEFGRVKGHFGPINSLAFHPNGQGYSSGGEDGYVRTHEFERDYKEFRFEY